MAAEHELGIPPRRSTSTAVPSRWATRSAAAGRGSWSPCSTACSATGGRRGIAALCIGGGEAVALAVETIACEPSTRPGRTLKMSADTEANGPIRPARRPQPRFWLQWTRAIQTAGPGHLLEAMQAAGDPQQIQRAGSTPWPRASTGSCGRPAFLEAMQRTSR